MSDFFFVLKCLVATMALICLMQIRIGGRTIEQRSMSWVRHSATVDNLRAVAEGAVKAMGKGYRHASDFVQDEVGAALGDDSSTRASRSAN